MTAATMQVRLSACVCTYTNYVRETDQVLRVQEKIKRLSVSVACRLSILYNFICYIPTMERKYLRSFSSDDRWLMARRAYTLVKKKKKDSQFYYLKLLDWSDYR